MKRYPGRPINRHLGHIGGWVDRQMCTHSKIQAAKRTHRQMDLSANVSRRL